MVHKLRDLVELVLFSVVGIAISELGEMIRRQTKRLREFEECLRESEDRYRDLVEHSEDLLCTHDLNGMLLSVIRLRRESWGMKPRN